jgi:zinc protease
VGTLESVAAIKPEQLEPHLKMLRETGRILFVAVGDLDPNHVIEQVKAAFGSLPRGTYQDAPLPALNFAASELTSEKRELPTNYIEAVFPGPGWRDADFAVGLVAMHHLGWREFEEVRTKRNLSYAPGAWLQVSTGVPVGALYVTAVDPNTTLKVMYDEAHKLQQAPVDDHTLTGAKSTFLSGLLMKSESMDGQANLLANAQLYAGDWHRVRDLPGMVRAVTPAQVQDFAKKYIGKAQVELVGDPGKVDPAVAKSL